MQFKALYVIVINNKFLVGGSNIHRNVSKCDLKAK